MGARLLLVSKLLEPFGSSGWDVVVVVVASACWGAISTR